MFEDAENNDKGNDSGSKSGANAFFRIFKYADTTSRILYSIALLGAIASGAALPMMTLLFGQSIGSFSNFGGSAGSGGMDVDAAQRFRSDVDRFVLYFVYLFAARFVVGYIATLCVCVAAARTTNALRKAFLEGLLRREVADLDVADSGSAATQVTTNGNRINQGIAEKLYAGMTGASLFFSSYIVALAVQWKLALITMSIIPAIILVVGGAFSADAPIESRITRIYSEAANTAQDALGSTKTITAFGAQKRVVSWYDDYLRRAHTEGMKKSLIFGVLFGGQTFITMAGTALAFWQGFRLFDSGEIASVGTVFTVTLSVTLGATSVVSMLPQFQAFSSASSAAAELFSFMDKPSALDPMSDKGEKPAADACEGEIVFRDVHFMYPARPGTSVLQGLNLSIPRGKTTALVGPSGCGKSTVVGLLQRWYEPSQGQVLLGGRDISQLNKTWLRTRMRVVQQESTLFQATVFENVSTGLAGEQRDLPQAEQRKLVVEACKSADAHAFIEQLPQGYDTHLGDGARILSGGQRQRLAIARSIISSPQILLCDEATSALDVHAETVVQKALNQVSKNKTMLVIAHKLATVMAADNIAVMASGRVVEQGNHQQLVEQDGLYAAMVRAQDLGGEDRGEVGRNAHNDEHSIAHDSTIAFPNDNLNKSTTTERSRPHQKDDEKRLATQTTPGPYLDAETANVSLPKAIFIMLREAPDLYKWYCVIAFAYICTGATYPAQALIFSRLIGIFSLEGAEATQQANFYALMFFIVALANLVGFFFIGIATNVIGQALTYRYRCEMLERMLDMDQQFFDIPSNSSAALVSKLLSVPNALQELMSANVGLMASVLINVLATSVTGIAVGWKLGLVLVVVGLLAISGSGYLRIRLDQKLEAAAERQFICSAALAVEAVGSIRTVSSLTLEREVLARYSSSLDSILAKATRSLMTTLIPYSLSQSAEFLVLALGFWYGSRLVASGEYTTTQFFVVFIAVVFGEQATAQFFTWTTSINKGKVAANYLLWLRSIQPEIRETDENRNKGLPTLRGDRSERVKIEFRSVDMQYSNARRRNDSRSSRRGDNAKVLRDLSFSIKPGSYVAFVGASGCGKSTIMSLVQRFYDPTSGTVVMNGTDISTVSPARYRQQISLVQQEPPLYMGSVRDNILLGMAGDDRENQVSEDDIRKACRQADAWDFISSLPEGLNTSCGTRGAPRFSGGQRQRIALARALISQPRVLLLDEATSALDTQSEQVVQRALDTAAATRTTIAVAHRLSTIRRADVIFVVERGRIVESGTHAELVRARGRYHAMCLAQSLDAVV